MPEISVIMGVYNCKNFALLKKSIESIIDQTYTDWEFIICDDGSTNETRKELETLAQLDPRIRIIGYEKNRGLSSALNECLKYAKGTFIAREDDDDYSDSHRFEKQINFIRSHPEYAIVGTNAAVINQSGEWGQYVVPEKPLKKDFLWNSPFLHPSILIRKSALESVNGYGTSAAVTRVEDYDLFMRLYSKGFAGYNIQEKLYNYWILNDPNVNYRPMKVRINEMKVRYKGFKSMGILLIGIPYVLKPVILGLVPNRLFAKLRKKIYKKKH